MIGGRGSAGRCLLTFLGGVVTTVLAVVGSVEWLDRFAPEHLPPPSISNRIDLDEKLRFLRRHSGWHPTVLAVGSSITMRSLDGAPFSKGRAAKDGFLNVAFGGAQVHEAREAGLFYLDLFPGVQTVVQLAVPPDFRNCSEGTGSLFDVENARKYVLGRMRPSEAYLRYFNPHELIPEALDIARARKNWAKPGERKLYTDPFGSMPMDMSLAEARQRHRVLYTETDVLDAACFRELQAWARDVGQRGVRLVLIVPPFSPIFLRTVPGAPHYIDEFVQRVAAALRGTPAMLIDERSIGLGDEAFADAYHLLWPAARVFSKHVSADVEMLAAGAAESVDHSKRSSHGTEAGAPGGWPRS